MDEEQHKVKWQGTVVSIQIKSTVWRYRTDNRTHREKGFNLFLKGTLESENDISLRRPLNEKYDFCVAISEKQQESLKTHIGDELKGTGWTVKYPEREFADIYRAGSMKKIRETENIPAVPKIIWDQKPDPFTIERVPRVESFRYPGPPYTFQPPVLNVYGWRGARLLSKVSWKGKCFQCVWANMANVIVEYDFDRNVMKYRFETFCYGPLSCPYYRMGPGRAVPYKGMETALDNGDLDEVLTSYRLSNEE